MTVIDGIWQPDYQVKSAIKLGLFLVFPFLYSVFIGKLNLIKLFKANKKGMKLAVVLCVPTYIVIVAAYILLKDYFDFSKITGALTGNIGVTRDNFFLVALYISFINSLLEEFFFRGFAFLSLKKVAGKRKAYIFSAAIFAFYHIAIMTGWFSVGMFLIAIAGLFAGGLVLSYLNLKSGNIYTSWFVHMFANFAINTVGFMLFGII
ncbi:MAG: CPBP family intramembrane metalloprotease [Clostridia bacterium]|nr:CPBP family intramembrane metalloprotease [Clostridia bacterium]